MRFEIESFKYFGMVANNFFCVNNIAEVETVTIEEIRQHSRVTVHDNCTRKTYEILDFHEVYDVLHMLRQ